MIHGKGGDLTTSASNENSPEVSASSLDATALADDRASFVRAAMLVAGAAGAGLLSVWSWMIGRVDGQFILKDGDATVAVLPTLLVYAAVAGLAMGGAGVLWALLKDMRLRALLAFCYQWARTNPLIGIAIAAVVALGAIDLYEVLIDAEAMRWNRGVKQELRAYMVREDLKAWLLFTSTMMAALAMTAAFPPSPACPIRAARVNRIFDGDSKRGLYVIAFLFPVVLASLLCIVGLEGLPHFSDSLTYLQQARMLENGQLAMDKPAHPELWIGSLFFVTDGQHFDANRVMVYEGTRMFGKYPIGWPAVLAVFDKFNLGFLANAVLSGFVAVLTGLLAAQFTTKRVAVIAALLYGLSPWAWYNGANFASHVASTVAVTGFLWLYLRAYRLEREEGNSLPWSSALGAGLFLGAAVLVRPFDAAMFALPAVILTVALLIRRPKVWLPLGIFIAVGALVGVGVYVWANTMTTGDAKVSPYNLEGRWNADWEPVITSIVHRVQFQWSELNARFPGYGIGGMTAAFIGLIIAVRSRACHAVGLGLTIACSALFLVTAAAFLFTNVWWGPRWLLPMTPIVAILGAVLVDTVIAATRGQNELQSKPDDQTEKATENASESSLLTNPAPLRHPAQMVLTIFLAGICVAMAVELPGKLYVHRTVPPHNVSGQAMRHIEAAGLKNAIVAMPRGGKRAPLDARAGLVFMQMPFDANNVIFVRNVKGWQEKALECFPDRQLYELIADTNSEEGFLVRPAVAGETTPDPKSDP